MSATNSQLKYRLDFHNVPKDRTLFILREKRDNKRGFLVREALVQEGWRVPFQIQVYSVPGGYHQGSKSGEENDITEWLTKCAHSWCLKDE